VSPLGRDESILRGDPLPRGVVIHDLQRRIQRLYRRDRLIAIVLVVALVGTLLIVYRATGSFASPAVRAVLALSGGLLLVFNAASIWALLRHNREDKNFIYTLDIKHLDEYRGTRAAARVKSGEKP
jgi:hypothetical protein